ncbi:MAG: hypothetical protein IPM18_05270 [Phycisphaerales bacterium]|nr:hypothetical protein [Phycisphaerales bacterium]
MNKWLGLVMVLALVGGVWYVARQQTLTPVWAQPKFAKVERGDIQVPIGAPGLIQPAQIIEVKSEASGRIIDVTVVEGRFVQEDQPLVVLDPADEERMRDRAKADLDRADAILKQARVAVQQAEANIETARHQLAELVAQARVAKFARDEMEENVAAAERRAAAGDDRARPAYSMREQNDLRARDEMSQAQVKRAEVAVRSAELSLEDTRAAVLSQEALVESARKSWEDAEERVRKTTVLAAGSGIVTDVYVKTGMLVQSATQGFTGGTVLLRYADVSTKKVVAKLDEAHYGRVLNVSPTEALPEMPNLRNAAEQNAAQMTTRSGTVQITVDAFPDEIFEGRIIRVEPQGRLNPGSSVIQFDVHVEITDAQRFKLPSAHRPRSSSPSSSCATL